MCVKLDQYFLLKFVGLHLKFPVSEKISWEPSSQVPEENPTLAQSQPARLQACMSTMQAYGEQQAGVRSDHCNMQLAWARVVPGETVLNYLTIYTII